MIRGRLLGPITGGTCIVHPGTRAPEHPVTDLLSQNIRCVCDIAWADFWGLLPGTPTLFTPGRAAPEGPATCLPSRHILCVIDGLYCVLLTGVDYWGHLSGNTHIRCSPRNTPLQSAL